MKVIKQSIQLNVLASIAYFSHALAAPGFTALPATTPFSHPTVTGASTAYVRCNPAGVFYVRTSCSTAAPIAVAGAIRLRQSFQNQSTDGFNPPVDLNFIEVPLLGFVPPNGAVNPLPVSPF